MLCRLPSSVFALAAVVLSAPAAPVGAETAGRPLVYQPDCPPPAGADAGRRLVFQPGCLPPADCREPVFQTACPPPPCPVNDVQYAPCPVDEACCLGDCPDGCGCGDRGDGWDCPGLDCLLESVSVRGWLSQGFTWNPDSPADRFNGPVTFNDRSNEYQMNQLYLVLERPAGVDPCGWDVGGRVDLLYGTDYFFVEANGLETRQDGAPRWNSADGPRGLGAALYGLAMPQLYAEVAAPLGGGLSVKMGHFYSILGYESVMDPENFFYSRSYMRQYGEPFTHTGFLASYGLSPRWTLLGGMTRGWDTWEDPNGKQGFLGGLEWSCPDGQSALGFALHTGNEDLAGRDDRTVYSLVYQRHLTPCLTYVFQHDLGVEAGAATSADFEPDTAKWYGITQYLMVTVSPTTAVGLRVEWFRDQDNARVLGIPFESLSDGGNYVELTLGMNWQPQRNVTLRSELRWDRSDVDAPALRIGGMYDDFQDRDQLTWATNLILLF